MPFEARWEAHLSFFRSHRRTSLISAVGTLVTSGPRPSRPRLRRVPGCGGPREPLHPYARPRPSPGSTGESAAGPGGEREALTELTKRSRGPLLQRAGVGRPNAATEPPGGREAIPHRPPYGIRRTRVREATPDTVDSLATLNHVCRGDRPLAASSPTCRWQFCRSVDQPELLLDSWPGSSPVSVAS